MHKRSKLGLVGQNYAERFLVSRGYSVLARNYRCRRGELDLVVLRGGVLSFVEVKTRRKEYFPTVSVVNKDKQNRIGLAARDYIFKNRVFNKVIRFDIVTVLFVDGENHPKISVVENAFQIPTWI